MYVYISVLVHCHNDRLTFIISSNVLKTISIIIKYSNGVETTMRHTLYLNVLRFLGMYRSSGRAPIVKSMQDFCKYVNKHSKQVCNILITKYMNRKLLGFFFSYNITCADSCFFLFATYLNTTKMEMMITIHI